jgi:hypothetical protein
VRNKNMEDRLIILLEKINGNLEEIANEMRTMNTHLYAIGCEIQPIAAVISDIGGDIGGDITITAEGLAAINKVKIDSEE